MFLTSLSNLGRVLTNFSEHQKKLVSVFMVYAHREKEKKVRNT